MSFILLFFFWLEDKENRNVSVREKTICFTVFCFRKILLFTQLVRKIILFQT